MRAAISALLVLIACNPGPVTPPPPDASDAGIYVACCAAMGDTTPECQQTLQHVVEAHLTSIDMACSKCGLACP
jgi:hypothetical protein